MFTKTLLATVTAGFIAAGSLGATTTSASAATYVAGVNNHGWFFAYRPAPLPRPVVVRQVCSPTYRTIKVWRPYYGWTWQTVNAGPVCHPVATYPIFPHW